MFIIILKTINLITVQSKPLKILGEGADHFTHLTKGADCICSFIYFILIYISVKGVATKIRFVFISLLLIK